MLKINDTFLITQHCGSGACGGMAEKFPPLPPFRHMSFYEYSCVIFFLKKVSVIFLVLNQRVVLFC
jgi:hypothetical protein